MQPMYKQIQKLQKPSQQHNREIILSLVCLFESVHQSFGGRFFFSFSKPNLKQTHTFFYQILNPNYALDFVMKSKNTRKLSTHGLFKILEYINILTF